MAKTHKYVLQVVIETEEDYSKKRVREAFSDHFRGILSIWQTVASRMQKGPITNRHILPKRIHVRREVDKQ